MADTNIFIAVALEESEQARIVRLTSGATVTAPAILPYEIGNALSAMVKRKRLTGAQALEAERVTRRIAVRLVDVEVQASLCIALSHDIYAYDAYFLQCAQRSSQPLLTLDRRMQQVASRLGIKVLERMS